MSRITSRLKDRFMFPCALPFLLLMAVPAVALAQSSNPLVRPLLPQNLPQILSGENGGQRMPPSLPGPQSSSVETKRTIPRFDGWFVSYVSSKRAVLRLGEVVATNVGASTSAKPGAPGFGTGGEQHGQSSVAMMGQYLEVSHGQIFPVNDAVMRAKIDNGNVTISYLGHIDDLPSHQEGLGLDKKWLWSFFLVR